MWLLSALGLHHAGADSAWGRLECALGVHCLHLGQRLLCNPTPGCILQVQAALRWRSGWKMPLRARFSHCLRQRRVPDSMLGCIAQVQVALGAEEAVAYCGGLRALLAAVGLPAGLELPAAPAAPGPGLNPVHRPAPGAQDAGVAASQQQPGALSAVCLDSLGSLDPAAEPNQQATGQPADTPERPAAVAESLPKARSNPALDPAASQQHSAAPSAPAPDPATAAADLHRVRAGHSSGPGRSPHSGGECDPGAGVGATCLNPSAQPSGARRDALNPIPAADPEGAGRPLMPAAAQPSGAGRGDPATASPYPDPNHHPVSSGSGRPSAWPAEPPVSIAWAHYAQVAAVLWGRAHGLCDLLTPAGLVPKGTLAALRCFTAWEIPEVFSYQGLHNGCVTPKMPAGLGLQSSMAMLSVSYRIYMSRVYFSARG